MQAHVQVQAPVQVQAHVQVYTVQLNQGPALSSQVRNGFDQVRRTSKHALRTQSGRQSQSVQKTHAGTTAAAFYMPTNLAPARGRGGEGTGGGGGWEHPHWWAEGRLT